MPAAPVTELHVETLGVVVPLAVSGTDLAEAVAEAWRDAVRHGNTLSSAPLVAAPLTVAVGERGDAVVAGLDVAATVHALSTVVMKHAIASRSGELVMLGARAVVDPGTRSAAVLVAARTDGSGTSPTTLAGDLVHLAGHTTAITADGLVLAALDPLTTRESGTVTRSAPSALGLTVATGGSYPVGALLVLQHKEHHAGEPVVEAIDTIDAVAAMADVAAALHYLEAPLQRLADVVRRAGGARLVTYADPETLSPTIRGSLAGAVT